MHKNFINPLISCFILKGVTKFSKLSEYIQRNLLGSKYKKTLIKSKCLSAVYIHNVKDK